MAEGDAGTAPGAGDGKGGDKGDPKGDPKDPKGGAPGGAGDGGDGGDGSGDGGAATFTAEYVAKLRKENAEARVKLKEATSALKEHEDKDKPEADKLRARVAELEAERAGWEAERKASKTVAVFAVAASKAGATYPDTIGRLVDAHAIEWTEDGEIRNAPELVKAVKERYPHMFTRTPNGNADGGAGNGSKPEPQSMNDLIRRAAGANR